MNLRPGSIVVLEGIDKSGKSTQRDRLAARCPDDLFVHQPSSGTELGAVIYEVTEKLDMNPLTRQLLHLASHSEMYERLIIPARKDRGIFMDRCWWSTLAYGWHAGGLKYLIDFDDFLRLARLPTQGVDPTIVFLFCHPYEHDPLNSRVLLEGYTKLAEQHSDITVHVPDADIEAVETFILDTLGERELLVELR